MRNTWLPVLFALLLPMVGLARGELTLASDDQAELTAALEEFERAQDLRQHDPDGARRLYLLAAQRLQSIASNGISNGYLEYNMGNCYQQAGDIGRAILHYRRAEQMIPLDPLLAENLKLARSRCLLSLSESRGSSVARNVFFWHHQTPRSLRRIAALVLYGAVWVLLLIRYHVPRRWLTGVTAAVALGAVACGTSVAIDDWMDRNAPAGVVTELDVVVYKGPGKSYQRQFEQPLQPGVEFTLAEQRGSWWNVRLPDGKKGWLESSTAELVPTG